MLDIINKLTLSLSFAPFRSNYFFAHVILSLALSLSHSLPLISVSTGTFLLKIYGKPY